MNGSTTPETVAAVDATSWPTLHLFEICHEISKGTTPLSYGHPCTTYGVPFLAAEDLGLKGVDTASVGRHVSPECHEFLRRSKLRPNDVLISIAGTLRRVSFLHETAGPVNCNQAVCFIRLDLARAHRDFVVYALRSNAIQNRLRGQGIGGGVTNLNLPMIRDFEIPLLPLAEQERIAGRLTEQLATVERAQEAAQSRLAAAESPPAAYLREVFEGPEASRDFITLRDCASIQPWAAHSGKRLQPKGRRHWIPDRPCGFRSDSA